MSRFTARKVQSAEPAQAHIEPRNALETKYKNARYATALIHRGISDVSIGKKIISEYKRQKKIPHAYTKSGQTLHPLKEPKTWEI